MLPIVRGYIDKIGAGMKVLEIGCGTWEAIKDRCDEVGAHYEGIEVNEYYFGKKTHATKKVKTGRASMKSNSASASLGAPMLGCTPRPA